ncbi:hypothetical protein [Isobaculum melis]|uniref:Uncharacterized protein n=1 Tax=Isobaculum melis TaxID=142588 RepID=A0A1H9TGR4_9LACT|nr:hypothetical protein [Isobaculum melis]SER96530.1 hypothetical protein SAMN04488559_11370 [Isobaculum melis]
MEINNTTHPRNTVINNVDVKSHSKTIIDFSKYPNWTHSTRIGNFTNQLKNEKECAKNYYILVSKLFPFLQNQGGDLFTGINHCHLLNDSDDKKYRTQAINIIENIHNVKFDKSLELWQLSYGQGIRLVGAMVKGGDNNNQTIIYPLFIDHHHLIYPDKNHNQKDLSKKACKFCPQDKYH